MKLEKIEKIEKIDNKMMTEYKNNSNIRRRKILKGGYTDIVFATDSDLD